MSREKILASIRAVAIDFHELPEIPSFRTPSLDVEKAFIQNAEKGFSTIVNLTPGESPAEAIKTMFGQQTLVASSMNDLAGTIDLDKIQSPSEMEAVDLAILTAKIGVAENGAVWLNEKNCIHRVLPFITQHLVILLNRESIVANMHEAYQSIQIAETGFGVFIAGPSKTADIEQSLVIGAQGARSLTIILTD